MQGEAGSRSDMAWITPVAPGQQIDTNKYLKRQKDEIKTMLLKTNSIMTAPKAAGNLDFVLHDMKTLGRVDIKQATPYTVYSGKVRVKGNENPLRVEILQEKLPFQFMFCFDDPTFQKNSVTLLRSHSDKLTVSLPTSAEYVYIRVYYESQDLTPVPLLVFRVYFGKQTNLLSSGDFTAGKGKGEGSNEDLLIAPGDKLPVSRSH